MTSTRTFPHLPAAPACACARRGQHCMRRIGTLHTLVAFGFNTAILATMINLAAGLF